MSGHCYKSRASHEVDGLTLIEMLVALLVLAVILSATASSLITFSASAVNTQTRVQATSLANELHERLQSAPWESAVHDVAELAGVGSVEGLVTGTTPTLDGMPLVLCESTDDAGCPPRTIPFSPDLVADIERDDLDAFDAVLQFVTWVDRPGVIDGEAKRFVTIVQWTIRGKTVVARLESERAASASEVADPPSAAVTLTFIPSSVALEEVVDTESGDSSFVTAQQLNVIATFPTDEADFVSNVQVDVPAADGSTRVVQLNRVDLLSRRFEGVLPVGEGPFADRAVSVPMSWLLRGESRSTSAPLSFSLSEGPPLGDDPQVVDGTATVMPNQVELDDNTWRLCGDVRLRVQVTQATEDGNVSAIDIASNIFRLNPTVGIDPSGMTEYERVFRSDAFVVPAEWRPQNRANFNVESVEFVFTTISQGGVQSDATTAAGPLTITRVNGCS